MYRVSRVKGAKEEWWSSQRLATAGHHYQNLVRVWMVGDSYGPGRGQLLPGSCTEAGREQRRNPLPLFSCLLISCGWLPGPNRTWNSKPGSNSPQRSTFQGPEGREGQWIDHHCAQEMLVVIIKESLIYEHIPKSRSMRDWPPLSTF